MLLTPTYKNIKGTPSGPGMQLKSPSSVYATALLSLATLVYEIHSLLMHSLVRVKYKVEKNFLEDEVLQHTKWVFMQIESFKNK